MREVYGEDGRGRCERLHSEAVPSRTQSGSHQPKSIGKLDAIKITHLSGMQPNSMCQLWSRTVGGDEAIVLLAVKRQRQRSPPIGSEAQLNGAIVYEEVTFRAPHVSYPQLSLTGRSRLSYTEMHILVDYFELVAAQCGSVPGDRTGCERTTRRTSV